MAESLGCSSAQRNVSGLVILDFGQPAVDPDNTSISGTFLLGRNAAFSSTTEIAYYTKRFIYGYMNPSCRPSLFPPYITVTIGTNNLTYTNGVMNDTANAQAHGQQWAQVVNEVSTWVMTSGVNLFLTVAGGTDTEIEWNVPTTTLSWARGYSSLATRPYYNYGSCEGCPPYTPSNGMENDWTIEDVYSTSWGVPSALPFPQIYAEDGSSAEQWHQVSAFSYNRPGFSHMLITGVLTEHGACHSNPIRLDFCQRMAVDNTPSAGWIQLWQALNWDPTRRTLQDLLLLNDITWDR